MALKLKQLLNMTARELKQLSTSELRESYQNIRKITNSRVNTFKKHGISEAVPKHIREGLGSSKKRSDQELIEDIRGSLAWMRGRVSKYSGWKEAREDRREKMQDAMPDLDLSTPEKLDDFGEFMGEMQDRYGEMWGGISSQVRDLYGILMKSNEDPYQFMRNYDYWKEHIEDINASRKATGRRGRLSTKPSTYFNKLKKGKIK